MKFIRRSILKLIKWAAAVDQVTEPNKYDDRKAQGTAIGLAKSSMSEINDMGNGMNFTMYNATGGKVVQIRSYNPSTDRSKSALYVITDTEDLGTELAQIITMERLSS
jgi:hypothetical protein